MLGQGDSGDLIPPAGVYLRALIGEVTALLTTSKTRVSGTAFPDRLPGQAPLKTGAISPIRLVPTGTTVSKLAHFLSSDRGVSPSWPMGSMAVRLPARPVSILSPGGTAVYENLLY